jgi:hypothetical protein
MTTDYDTNNESEPLIPPRLLFDYEFPLKYRKNPPNLTGRLKDWTDDELLPALCALETSQKPWADVWACWNEKGIYVACKVYERRTALECNPNAYWNSDNLRICSDMRDARANKRATRYCQQFFLMPKGGGPKRDQPIAASAKVKRATEEAPLFDADQFPIASRITKTSWQLEAHIPTECLIGFDPEQHPRIGLYYMLEDKDNGQQFLTVGDDLNWHIDPSTWPTAVMKK